MQKPSAFPTGRLHGLVSETLGDELMLFDPNTCKTHCLNRPAAIVWQGCDGKTSIEELARRVAEATGAPADVRVVELALRQLDAIGLLESTGEIKSEESSLDRRKLLGRLGWAAALVVGLPVISTVLAPRAGASPPPP